MKLKRISMMAALLCGCAAGRPAGTPLAQQATPAAVADKDASSDRTPLKATLTCSVPELQPLCDEAGKLLPHVETPGAQTHWVAEFLRAARFLPKEESHVFQKQVLTAFPYRRYLTPAQVQALPATEQEKFENPVTYDAPFYYYTHHGPPFGYTRAYQLCAQHGLAISRGSRVLDFGFGSIGQLRMLASMGADVTGIEANPLLALLYQRYLVYHQLEKKPLVAPKITSAPPAVEPQDGRLRLLFGRYPADGALAAAVGTDFDLVISKNVLKRGYIHPAQPVPENQWIDLKVSDESFVRDVYQRVKPGGYFMIYNFTPPPNEPGKPYITWADGRCPFARELLEQVGFEVLVYDRDDTAEGRKMWQWLGYEKEAKDIYAMYSLMRKPLKE